jgi:hypothetical protein
MVKLINLCFSVTSGGFLDDGIPGRGGLVRPLGRPGPALEGFGGLAGVPVSAIRR